MHGGPENLGLTALGTEEVNPLEQGHKSIYAHLRFSISEGRKTMIQQWCVLEHVGDKTWRVSYPVGDEKYIQSLEQKFMDAPCLPDDLEIDSNGFPGEVSRGSRWLPVTGTYS